MKAPLFFLLLLFFSTMLFAQQRGARTSAHPDSIATHKVLLDESSKIVSWIQPQSMAYDRFLRDRWNFIFTSVPNSPGPPPRSNYPLYYFYCAYKNQQMIPDMWMNDVAEKIPNWFESARLYYQYTGDMRAIKIVEDMALYAIDHGTTPSGFQWPGFPYTTTNAGDTLFRGFTTSKNNSFVLHEVQVDHAGDMGLTYYKLYQLTGNAKLKAAAVNVANVLARYAKKGTAKASVWPYRVVTSTGKITAPYGANWIGCYALLSALADDHTGNVPAYRSAMKMAKEFLLNFPLKTGFWTDGHTDTDVKSDQYKSNMSASNFTLYLLDHPGFDPHFLQSIPSLIEWTEKYFVERTIDNEPSNQWGANIVGEQDTFLVKMDYQTARYAAECARWYALSNDSSYKEKAFRCLNWVTYCSDTNGLAFESPVSSGITSWWSDCYGEGPRMFYHALAAVPEWAPANQNHILYSEGVLRSVVYNHNAIQYEPVNKVGTEYLKLSFQPGTVTLNGKDLVKLKELNADGYIIRPLADGGFALTINRQSAGIIVIKK